MENNVATNLAKGFGTKMIRLINVKIILVNETINEILLRMWGIFAIFVAPGRPLLVE